MATSLPGNPSLERFRRDARRLQRAARSGDPRALELLRRHHPDGMRVVAADLQLADAQLVVARGYGFASWPRLRRYLDVAAPLRRDPGEARPASLADRVLDRACLQYTGADEPARWAEAAALLDATRAWSTRTSASQRRPATRRPWAGTSRPTPQLRPGSPGRSAGRLCST